MADESQLIQDLKSRQALTDYMLKVRFPNDNYVNPSVSGRYVVNTDVPYYLQRPASEKSWEPSPVSHTAPSNKARRTTGRTTGRTTSPMWFDKFKNSKGQFDISREDLEKWGNQFGDEATKKYIQGWAGKDTKALWKDKNSGIAQTFQNFTNWVKSNGGQQSKVGMIDLSKANNNYIYGKNGWMFNDGPLGTVNQTKGTVNPYKPVPIISQTNDVLNTKLNIKPLQTPLNMNRRQIRDYMRNNNLNPYNYSGDERRALRLYMNGDTTGSGYDINTLKNSELATKLNLKFQKGGQLNMNEQQLQQAFLQYLMQKTGAQDEQQLEQVVQQLGEDGLKQAYAQFMQEMQQQQVQAAKFGAKLNYIKKLNGQCPEGMEMHYYKQGGRLCRKCIQAKQNEEEIEYPSNPIDAFKCGRKMKKKKCEIGGTVDMDKCGAKMKKKKCEDGGIVNIDKCGAKIKKKKCENGGLIPFDKCGNKMKKKQQGGDLETSKPTKTNKTPFIVYNDKGKKKVTYVKDQATRDSLYANRYNDQEVQATKPGSYKNGKWTPDRNKFPYKKK